MENSTSDANSEEAHISVEVVAVGIKRDYYLFNV